jgi:hypothetical protein
MSPLAINILEVVKGCINPHACNLMSVSSTVFGALTCFWWMLQESACGTSGLFCGGQNLRLPNSKTDEGTDRGIDCFL